MKKIIITAVLVALFSTSTAYAYVTFKYEDNESYTQIGNSLIDLNGVVNYKFTDKVGKETVTCYGSFTKRMVNGAMVSDSTSISCVK